MEQAREETINCTRREIFLIVCEDLNSALDNQIELLEKNLIKKPPGLYKFKSASISTLKGLLSKLKNKWKDAHYTLHAFYLKFDKWLDQTTKITIKLAQVNTNIDKIQVTSESSSGGRPTLPFADSSERSKRRKTEDMRDQYSTQELSFATKMRLRSSGAVSASKVLEDITTKSPTRADKYRTALSKSSNLEKEMSPDVALALMLDAKLTKSQYNTIRMTTKAQNSKVFPPYIRVLEAKQLCYPEKMSFSETRAEVELQSLLNHTTLRILHLQNDVLDRLCGNVLGNLLLVLKWGFDGSSGQSEYKQQFSNPSDSDSNVMLTSIVPLRLCGFDNEKKIDIDIWKNPRPSSPWYCRPIRLQFIHETKDTTKEEKRVIDDQIKSLKNFLIVIDGKVINVQFELACTMIDGKVCNVVTDTSSSMRCYLCNETSKKFNDIEAMKKAKIDRSKLQYGLSTLHCWIRFFECLLHIGYKKDSEKWQARGTEAKKALEERKKIIQNAFKTELSLIVDRPKQVAGNSNDGNTARRFFENSETSARILGIDSELIKRFHVILQVLSSGFNVKVNLFEKYCHETADLFVSLYPWYNMSTTVHKVLIHGSKIAENAILPIGQMSEEAQESRNKDVRNYRENFTRKCSRVKTIEDIFCRLLATSDPLISSMRKSWPKRGKSLSPEAIELLSYERFDSDELRDVCKDVDDVDSDTFADNDDCSESD